MDDDLISKVLIKEDSLTGRFVKEIDNRSKDETYNDENYLNPENEERNYEEDTVQEFIRKKLIDGSFIDDL